MSIELERITWIMNKVTEQTIQEINIQFYKAFESLSLERMEEVWKRSDEVVCVHPGWDLFRGWTATGKLGDRILKY